MATFAFVDVDLDEAKPLADLNGVAIDLESALALAKYLGDRFASGAFDMEVVDAFSTAILVRYSRPFMTGVRGRLGTDVLKGLSPEQLQLHEKFMEWRSKHIAHSVNPFEENQVVAYYNTETVAETGIQSISVQQDRIVGLSLQDLTEIQTLAGRLLTVVRERIEAEKGRILEIVQNRPVEEVLASGVKRRGTARVESVSKARRRG